MREGLLTDFLPEYERQKNVTIEWKKPRLLDKKSPLDREWYDGQLENIGLYYISRTHGNSKKLRYIGKTSDSFYTRLFYHRESWLYYVCGKIYVRLGYIVKPAFRSSLNMAQLIKDVESALIYEMQPPDNKAGLISYTPHHLYRIKNIRYKGALPTTISMRAHIEDG